MIILVSDIYGRTKATEQLLGDILATRASLLLNHFDSPQVSRAHVHKAVEDVWCNNLSANGPNVVSKLSNNHLQQTLLDGSSPVPVTGNPMDTQQSLLIDPYQGKDMGFEDETTAYQHFAEHGGVESYSDKLNQTLMTIESPFTLIGFSAGASAIWQLNDQSRFNVHRLLQQVIGFYGGQIRHATNLTPSVNTKLIWPQKETHFDVLSLSQTLAKTAKVTCHMSNYSHGFMNALSPNFDRKGYHAYCKWIATQLR